MLESAQSSKPDSASEARRQWVRAFQSPAAGLCVAERRTSDPVPSASSSEEDETG